MRPPQNLHVSSHLCSGFVHDAMLMRSCATRMLGALLLPLTCVGNRTCKIFTPGLNELNSSRQLGRPFPPLSRGYPQPPRLTGAHCPPLGSNAWPWPCMDAQGAGGKTHPLPSDRRPARSVPVNLSCRLNLALRLWENLLHPWGNRNTFKFPVAFTLRMALCPYRPSL